MNIIVLDDCLDYLEIWQKTCKLLDIDVYTTDNPVTFISELNGDGYDYAFVDYKLKTLNGFCVSSLLNPECRKKTKIFLITGYNELYIQENIKTRVFVFDAVLSKTVDLRRILEKLKDEYESGNI